MKQLCFWTEKKNYARANRLIKKCSMRKGWHFWGVTNLVYFEVNGNSKYMARFFYESEELRVYGGFHIGRKSSWQNTRRKAWKIL